jgi:hypothetical protein
LVVLVLELLLGLPLLNVQLDEIGVLFDLVLGNTHGKQLLQERLP